MERSVLALLPVMDFTPVIDVFQTWVDQKIAGYYMCKPVGQSSDHYFFEHFFLFFGERQRLLDTAAEDQPGATGLSFARTLQNITETALEELKHRLQNEL